MLYIGTESEYPVFQPGDTQHREIRGFGMAEKVICREILSAENLPEGIYSSRANYPGGDAGAEVGTTNFLSNGDRLYAEIASKVIAEYSTGERHGALAATLCERRGVVVVRNIADRVAEKRADRDKNPFYLFRRTRDESGKTTGYHINMNILRRLQIERGALSPLFIGMIGGMATWSAGTLEEDGSFSVFQKALQIKEYISKETTTARKPLVNDRDEPHADWNKFRRLHIVGNDVLHSPWATWLRLNTYEMLAALSEQDQKAALALEERLPRNLELAMQKFSADPDFTQTALGVDGKHYTVLDYLDMAGDFIDDGIDAERISAEGKDAERAKGRSELNWARDNARHDPKKLDNLVDWRYRHNFTNDGLDKGISVPALRKFELETDDLLSRKRAMAYQASLCRFGFERLGHVFMVPVEEFEHEASDMHYVEPGGRCELRAEHIEKKYLAEGTTEKTVVDWECWRSDDETGVYFYGHPGSQQGVFRGYGKAS